LTVRVDPRYDGWWYEGGGIYRHVRLVMLDPVHVAPDGVFVAPTVADPGDGIQADAMVIATTEVTNTGAVAVSATVLSEILDAQGQPVAAQGRVHKQRSRSHWPRPAFGRWRAPAFISCAAPLRCPARWSIN
jgi:beta-galactosidase